jgi:hypothetical protein
MEHRLLRALAMKQHKARKLQLTKENLRTLAQAQLAQAMGGINTLSNDMSCQTCVVGCPSCPC